MHPAALEARSRKGWLPVHHACKHGCSLATLRLLLTDATARARTPGGYAPLHLLARHQAGDAAKLRLALELHPGGVRQRTADGLLPLHLLAAHSPGAAAALSMVLTAFPGAAVLPSAAGEVPLQLLPAGADVAWGTRQLLEAATLQQQAMRELWSARCVGHLDRPIFTTPGNNEMDMI